jgi:hypothetical protein
VAVLLFGKRLTLFAAAAGFLIGLNVMNALGQSTLIGVIVGVVVAILAVALVTFAKGATRLVVQIIGALAGGAIASWLAQLLNLDSSLLTLALIVVGALIGFLLLGRFFSLGIILLTSLLGASLIVNGVQSLVPSLPEWVFIVLNVALFIIGVIYQRRQS